MAESTDCVICGSELTTAKEKTCVCCPSCEKTACNACTRRYLSETHDMPHCLFCRKSWLHPFMIETFPSSFLNGPMKKSRQGVLLNEQKAMLPASHGDVQAEVRKRKRAVEMKAQLAKVADMKALVQSEERVLHGMRNFGLDRSEAVVRVVNKRSYKCPGEGCRGFLADWKCSVCELDVCEKCIAPAGAGHVCDEGAVETVRMLTRDTKPCPGCGEGIMKIVGGCDQMWCTGCQTTFSWTSGLKTHGHVHNPHYFEYLRKNGTLMRNPLDVRCGGMPDAARVTADCRKPWMLDINLLVERLRVYIRHLNHNREVESVHYPTTIDVGAFNTSLRVKFLLGEIDEATWRDSLYKNEKKHVMRKELGEIIALVDVTSTDIVRRIHGDIKELQKKSTAGAVKVSRGGYYPGESYEVGAGSGMTATAIASFEGGFKELESLRSYANDYLQRVGVSFGCKFPQYGSYFIFLKFGQKVI